MHFRKSFIIGILIIVAGLLVYLGISNLNDNRFKFIESKPSFSDYLLSAKSKSQIDFFEVVGNSYDTLIFIRFKNNYNLTIWKLTRFQNLLLDSIRISTNSSASKFNFNFISHHWGNFEYLFYAKPKIISNYRILIREHSKIYNINQSPNYIYLFLKTNGLGFADLENKYDFSIENNNEKSDIEIILLKINSNIYLLTLTSDQNISSMSMFDLLR